jgi:hypothetical protein
MVILTSVPCQQMSSAMIVLSIVNYTEKILALLDDSAYKKLPKLLWNGTLLSSLRGYHFLKMSPNDCDHVAQGHPGYMGSLR